jgi:hypothetical protein
MRTVVPHSRALCYDAGMADNPYQAPQTRNEVRVASAWRRHSSIWLITFGILASIALVAGLVGSVLLLNYVDGRPLLTGEHADQVMRLLWETVEAILVCAVLGPGLLLAGLATRQLIRWRTAGIAMLVVLVPISAYVAWWWPHVSNDLMPAQQQTRVIMIPNGKGEI